MGVPETTAILRSGRRAKGRSADQDRQPSLFDENQRSVSASEGRLHEHRPGCVRCKTTYLPVILVAERYGASPATIWRWVKTNPMFPRPVRLSRGMSRWRLADLVDFEEQKAGGSVRFEEGLTE